MKKLLAILTVMCMVLTTMIVPTVAFGTTNNSETTHTITLYATSPNDGSLEEEPLYQFEVPDGYSMNQFMEEIYEDDFSSPVELGYYMEWTLGSHDSEGNVTYEYTESGDGEDLYREYKWFNWDEAITSDAAYYARWQEIEIECEYTSELTESIRIMDDDDILNSINDVARCVNEYDSNYVPEEGEEYNFNWAEIVSDDFIVDSENAAKVVGNLQVNEATDDETGEISTITVTLEFVSFDEQGEELASENASKLLGDLGIGVKLENGNPDGVYILKPIDENVAEDYCDENGFDEKEGMVGLYIWGYLGTYSFSYAEDNEGDGGSDWWGDWGSEFEWFVLNSSGGLLTDEWVEDGTTLTESHQSLTWHYDPSITLGESMDGIDNAKLIDVQKDGWELLGWKLYTGENFKFVSLPAGEDVTFGDPEHAISYVDTVYYEAGEFGEDSEEGLYDEYLIVLNQTEITKTDGSLYTTEEIKDFVGENVIYYAVAQWDEVKVLESDKKAEEVLADTNEAIINVAKGESVEGEKTPVVDEVVVNALKDAIEVAETTGDKVKVETTVYAELVQKDSAEDVFGEVNVELVEAAVEAINKDAVIAQYLDLTVLMTVLVNDEPVKEGEVTELTEKIPFTIQIPEKLKNVPEGYERVFFIIRVHDGITEKLPVDVNDDGTLAFETDKFSTYALAYEDLIKDEQTGGGEGETTAPEGPKDDQNNTGDGVIAKPDNVVAETVTNTGDDFSAVPYIAVTMIALAGVAAAMFRRRTVK